MIVSQWNDEGEMIPGTAHEVPATPDALARAAMGGYYAECDTQKKPASKTCDECGQLFKGAGRFCTVCYVRIHT